MDFNFALKNMTQESLVADTDFNSHAEIRKMKESDWHIKCVLLMSSAEQQRKQTVYKMSSWKKHSSTYNAQLFEKNRKDGNISLPMRAANSSVSLMMNCVL